jgi:glycosyltransferase involved in cell wall biosynthesis
VTQQQRTPLLPAATENLQQGDYRGALGVYEELAQRTPKLLPAIGWNIDLCCQKLLEQLGEDPVAAPGGEYRSWVLRAMQASRDPRLSRALPGDGRKQTQTGVTTLVSVVMPTWNREHTIGHAIRSVVSQTHRHWELLICDDGSTDNTEAVVAAFGDARIRYFKLPKANGAVARNNGMRNASGELIAFLDSDNIWSPDYLTTVVGAMAADPELDMVYTALLDMTLNGDAVTDTRIHYREFDFASLAYRNYIDLNTLSIRAKLPKMLGYFDPSLPRQQDWDLVVRYGSRTKVKGLNQPLVCYFRNEEWGQVTHTMQKVDTRSKVMNKNKKIVERFKPGNQQKWPTWAAGAKRRLSIKISAPNLEEGVQWGDYHYAHSLGKCLEGLGWSYQVDCQDRWYADACDVALVLRGRHRFLPDKMPNTVNLQWIISHPDRVKGDEFDDYDHILVASSVFARKVQKVTGTPVTTLFQAGNSINASDEEDRAWARDLVFVGSSRNQKRDMVEWCYEQKLPLHLYGTGWDHDPKAQALLKGDYVSNEELAEFYRSSRIVLNDHWPEMRANGFISNRIFDACAAGTLVITDPVNGLEEVFGDAVVVARNQKELAKKVRSFLENEEQRQAKAAEAHQIAMNGHTFAHRASFVDQLANQYLDQYLSAGKDVIQQSSKA